MTHVDASEITSPEFSGELASLWIIHMLGDFVSGRNQGIDKEEVEVMQQFPAVLRDIESGIGGIPNPEIRVLNDQSAGICWGMVHLDKSDFQPEQMKRGEGFLFMTLEREE
jgi:hypothetical protein